MDHFNGPFLWYYVSIDYQYILFDQTSLKYKTWIKNADKRDWKAYCVTQFSLNSIFTIVKVVVFTYIDIPKVYGCIVWSDHHFTPVQSTDNLYILAQESRRSWNIDVHKSINIPNVSGYWTIRALKKKIK